MQEPGLHVKMEILELQFHSPILFVTLSLCDISAGVLRLYQAAMARGMPLSPVSFLTNPTQD